VQVDGSAGTNGSGIVIEIANGTFQWSTNGNPNFQQPGAGDVHGTGSAFSGTAYGVNFSTSIVAYSDFTFFTGITRIGHASVYLDPVISIDPIWLATHPGYSVVVSEGIGNTRTVNGSVPEPTTVALLELGLAGLGFSRRKSQAKNLS
jgi:hypothetical protein